MSRQHLERTQSELFNLGYRFDISISCTYFNNSNSRTSWWVITYYLSIEIVLYIKHITHVNQETIFFNVIQFPMHQKPQCFINSLSFHKPTGNKQGSLCNGPEELLMYHNLEHTLSYHECWLLPEKDVDQKRQ